MKKLSLLFTLFLSVTFVYSQENSATISGEKRACPGKEYEYKFKLAKPATINLTPSITVENGTLLAKSENLIAKDGYFLTVFVQWDDKGYRDNKVLTIQTNEGDARFPVVVVSYAGTSAADHSNYLFYSSPYRLKDNVIKIPYAQTGTLNMSTAGALPLDPNNSANTTNKYVWDIPGQGKIETINKYNLQYGLTDLDGVTVKVYPFNELCDKKAYGDPYSVKIERYLDAKITTTEKESCKNTNVTYKLEGAPSGSTIEWVPGDNVTIVSGQGSSSAIFKTSSDGALTVNAVVTYMGKNITISNSDVWVGMPSAPTQIIGLEDEVTFTPSSSYVFKAIGSIGATEYEWIVTGGTILMENNKQLVTIKMDALGKKEKFKPFEITLFAKNKCGRSLPIIRSGGITSGGDDYEPYRLRNNILDSEFTPQSIKIYNLSGAIVHSQDNLSGDFDIKSTTLPDGIYIIEKSDGKERQSEKVILKR